MDDRARLSRVTELLHDAGYGALAEVVDLVRRREHSTVYSAWLRDVRGDAKIDVFVYDLIDDPAGIVDAEEERIALTELDSDLVPKLLSYQVKADLAVLIVADAASAARLNNYLAPHETTEELSYQPDVDRLFGADYLHQIEDDRIASSCLMTMRRAQALTSVLRHLAATTGSSADNPVVPIVLGAYEVEPVTGIQSLEELPADYATLAMLTMVISPNEPLRALQTRLDAADASRLAIRLFDTLREVHRLPATLCRAGGCSLNAAFVTPTGDLTDPYFLTAGEEFDATDLAELQVRDILNLVHLLTETVSRDDPLLTRVLNTGIETYTGLPVGGHIPELIRVIVDIGDVRSMQMLAVAVHPFVSR